MIGKLLGDKDSKKGNYFLELDETEESKASTPEVATTEAPAPKAEEVVEAPAPEAKGKASKVKAKGKAKAAPKTTPVAAPKAAPVAPKKVEPVIANFATDYLMPSPTKIRRTPGPGMASFLEMARQVGK
jgi:hypothetical protein